MAGMHMEFLNTQIAKLLRVDVVDRYPADRKHLMDTGQSSE